jgi:hypothetical protein
MRPGRGFVVVGRASSASPLWERAEAPLTLPHRDGVAVHNLLRARGSNRLGRSRIAIAVQRSGTWQDVGDR